MTTSSLRICINLYPVPPGAGGVATFCRWIVNIPQWAESNHQFEVLLHPSQGQWSQKLAPGRPFEPFRGSAAKERIPSLARRIYDHRFFPEAARRACRWVLRHPSALRRKDWLESQGFDLIHCPYPRFDPWPPDQADRPYCINLHDLQHEHFPQFFKPHQVRRAREVVAICARLARAIFVLAEHIKEDVVHYCQVEPEKIHVIWPGSPFDGLPEVSEAQRADVRRRYGLPERFFFYPAVTWEHKNHRRLLQAAARVREKPGYRIPLVFCGTPGPYHKEVQTEASCLGLDRQVHWLGHLPYQDVRVLYTLAEAMVMPTLYEGFGIPVVEALASGCPVACSTAANLFWVVQEGEAGILFDPREVEAIAGALVRLWEDAALRGRLAAAGKKRSRDFSWRSFAEGYLRVYEQVAADGHP